MLSEFLCLLVAVEFSGYVISVVVYSDVFCFRVVDETRDLVIDFVRPEQCGVCQVFPKGDRNICEAQATSSLRSLLPRPKCCFLRSSL